MDLSGKPVPGSSNSRNKTWTSGSGLALRLTVFVYLILLLLLPPLGIFTVWNGTDEIIRCVLSYSEGGKQYVFSALAGLNGGSLYMFVQYYRRYRDYSLDLFRYWPQYFGRPLMSSVFSLMVFALLKSGILALKISNSSNAAIVAISFLVGYGFHQVNLKVEETVKTLFATKDPEDEERKQSDESK